MYDIITVGSTTQDVFIDTDSELIKIKSLRGEEDFLAYPAGSKILVKNLIFTTGGGGTNTAVSFARLGLKTAYLGKVGNDPSGQRSLDAIKKEGISFIGVRSQEMTGYSVILDSIEEDRTILTYKGANDNLSFEELKKSKLNAKWMYFSSMMGESYKTLEKLADFAARKKIRLAFNPSSYLASKGMHYLMPILSKANVLVLNLEEANLVLGMVHARPAMLLHGLSHLGPQYVVITNGRHGVYATDGKGTCFVQARKVKVVETTGAGDAFAAGFVAGLIQTSDFKLSLKIAMVNAESVLTHKGAIVNLPRWQQVFSAAKTGHFVFQKL